MFETHGENTADSGGAVGICIFIREHTVLVCGASNYTATSARWLHSIISVGNQNRLSSVPAKFQEMEDNEACAGAMAVFVDKTVPAETPRHLRVPLSHCLDD